jgi:hypothetical protein
MATVTVHVAGTPDGEDVEVPGLGSVPNNGTKEVDTHQIQLFEALGFTFPTSGELVIKVPPDPADELADTTKTELLNRAKELGIEGRSSMTKEELAEAIVEFENAPLGEVTPADTESETR